MVKPERIIPTRMKRKIAHDLSYPLGAEVISQALAESAQFEDLSIHFLTDPWVVARQNTERLLFSCKHSSRAAELPRNWTDEFGVPLFSEWQVNVYAVPKEMRHRVRTFLTADALPKVGTWLERQAQTQMEGEQVIEFFLDTRKDEFASRERDTPRPELVGS